MSFSSQPGCSATSNPVRKLNSSIHNGALKSINYRPKAVSSSLQSSNVPTSNLASSESSAFQHWKDFSQSISQDQRDSQLNFTARNSPLIQSSSWSEEFSAYNQQSQKSIPQWHFELKHQLSSRNNSNTLNSKNELINTAPIPFTPHHFPLAASSTRSTMETTQVDEDELMEQFNNASLQSSISDNDNFKLNTQAQAPLTLEHLWRERLTNLRTNGFDPKSLEEYQTRWEEFYEEAKINFPYLIEKNRQPNSFITNENASNQYAYSAPENTRALDTANLNKENDETKEDTSIDEQVDTIDLKKLNSLPLIENAYEKAQKILESNGPICEAAVLLEKSVLQNPSHLESWQSLAYVHTLLGNEMRVVEALLETKSLSSDHINTEMDLAVAYVNQGSRQSALACLRDWLYASHPEYSSRFSSIESKFEKLNVPDSTKAVQACFLDLIYLLSTSKKADDKAQTGLGITMYLLDDFSKAADCFQKATQSDPKNCVLWNKLGASLTNSKQEGRALKAYKRSLELQPQYVRTRSNLSIACINMSCYEEAAEHILNAINIVQDKHGILTHCESCTELWDMLRKVLLVGYQSMSLASLAKPGSSTSSLRNKIESYTGEDEYYEE
ncbi:peroxisomal targeting signal receptor Pex5 [Schizosaccharomyces octosporus yFS286]|uniref:Peroxisomal targeting signal receptor Pex5 n=1 Tax=Schizosaccharomyces octosporus (strain yFS286) TaxID=483514 RepID=S9PYQ2_SCHOY|nr:peroxisomal targeting signal receptor Pex5 [Schizosaccharomyces octosporus yFS286]EPX74216.1 peroxisomal targeting signal receptor Pex5 [Schizosaccharomyces octosporus yFS286]